MESFITKIKEAWEKFLENLEEYRERKALENDKRQVEKEKRKLAQEQERERKRIEQEELRQEKERIAEEKRAARRAIEEEKRAKQEQAKEEKRKQQEAQEAEKRRQREEQERKRAEARRLREEERQKQREEREALRREKRELADKARKEREEKEREKQAILQKEAEAKRQQSEEAKRKALEAKKLKEEEKRKRQESIDADREYRQKEKEERRQEKERLKLEARRKKAARGGKKANKKLAALEAQIKNADGVNDAEKEELLSLQDTIGKKKSSLDIGKLLKTSIFNKSFLAIEVKEDKTYIAEVTVSGGPDIEAKRVTLSEMLVVDTPESTFVDGMPYNVDRLALEIMKALVNRNIGTKEVIFVSNDKAVYARDLEDVHLQKSEKSNLEMIRNMSAELFPMDLSEYIIRYRVIDKRLASGEEKGKPNISLNIDINTLKEMFKGQDEIAKVKVMAFPKQLEEAYRRLASLSSLTLTAIDYSLNSSLNFIIREYRTKTEIVLDINSDFTNMFLVASGKILAQDSVSIGYNAIWQKVALYNNSYLGSNVDEVLYTLKEYKLLEDEEYLNKFAEEKGLKQLEVSELYSLLDEIREDLAKILNSTIHMADIQKERYSDLEINHATVLCSKKNFPDLSDDFKNAAGIELSIPDNYLWVTTIDNETPINEFRHIVGSSLGPINFKDKAQEISKEAEKRLKIGAGAIICVGLAGIVGAIGYTQYVIKTKQAEKVQLEQTLVEYQEAEQIAKRHTLSQNTLASVVEFNEYTSNTDQLAEIIGRLEEVTPKTIIYDTISSNDSSLLLSLKSKTREDIIKLLDELQSMEYFDDVSTSGLTQEEDGETGGISYALTIMCVYHVELPPPPPETQPAETTAASEESVDV